jgi:tRNA-Thr(GGU) m(6)t(6)A37 methyltransferase TsaA
MYKIEAIGIVRNECSHVANAKLLKEKISTIIISDKYSEGLYKIEEFEYIDVIFHFHKAEDITLKGKTHFGEEHGVFASRSPKRPNSIGISTVKLLNRNKNILSVKGLDAIDGTPVIDIKCCDTSMFAIGSETDIVHQSILRSNPRIEIWNNIIAGKTDILLLKAGQIHGHFCSGLAMGVMAATFAMQKLKTDSDGMEDLLAIVETNNCFSDGVQLVTGCSFGNNSLIYHDLGKTAFTLTRRNGWGIRIISLPESGEYINNSFPEFNDSFTKVVVNQNHDEREVSLFKMRGIERAFATLSLDFSRLFGSLEVFTDISNYAPIYESAVCSICGESVMKPRTIEVDNNIMCLACAKQPFGILDGEGLHMV